MPDSTRPRSSPSSSVSPPPPPASSGVGRRLVLELTLGAVLGFLGWSFTGPTIISWWYEPPSKDAFSCAGSVRMALAEFVKMQLGSAVVGAIGLTVTLFVIRRVFRPSNKTATG